MAERLMIEVPMPRASEIYYNACGMVDSHNRIREMCGIDKRLRTNNWATRVNFLILSMIFVDAYLLYKACCGDSAKENPKMFFEKLAAELIDFSFDEEGTKTRGKKRKKSEMDRRLTIPSSTSGASASGRAQDMPSKGVVFTVDLTQPLFAPAVLSLMN